MDVSYLTKQNIGNKFFLSNKQPEAEQGMLEGILFFPLI
jgi:hypothetical protein